MLSVNIPQYKPKVEVRCELTDTLFIVGPWRATNIWRLSKKFWSLSVFLRTCVHEVMSNCYWVLMGRNWQTRPTPPDPWYENRHLLMEGKKPKPLSGIWPHFVGLHPRERKETVPFHSGQSLAAVGWEQKAYLSALVDTIQKPSDTGRGTGNRPVCKNLLSSIGLLPRGQAGNSFHAPKIPHTWWDYIGHYRCCTGRRDVDHH